MSESMGVRAPGLHLHGGCVSCYGGTLGRGMQRRMDVDEVDGHPRVRMSDWQPCLLLCTRTK